MLYLLFLRCCFKKSPEILWNYFQLLYQHPQTTSRNLPRNSKNYSGISVGNICVIRLKLNVGRSPSPRTRLYLKNNEVCPENKKILDVKNDRWAGKRRKERARNAFPRAPAPFVLEPRDICFEPLRPFLYHGCSANGSWSKRLKALGHSRRGIQMLNLQSSLLYS